MDDTARRIDSADDVRDAGNADVDERTHEIRREIEQTREDMSETIDAIQEKLKPGNIVAGATERVKEAATERLRNMTHSASETAGSMVSRTRETASDMMDGASQNAVPIALIGIGAAWLLMTRSKSRHSWHDDDNNEYGRGRASRSGGFDDYASRQSRRRTTEGGFDRLQRVARDNPLIAGACALVAGAAVGLMLPETDRENEWMGEAREDLVDRAQDMARTAATTVQDVAGEAAGNVVSRVVSGTRE